MDKNDLYNMAGGSQGASLPRLKGIRLNGNTGEIIMTHLDQEKGEDGKYKKDILEAPLDLVFIKVRRKLIEGDKDGVVRSTSEHNSTVDVVKLYDNKTKTARIGIAQDLRDENERLKTEQVVYALYNGDVVRVSIKGTSLRKLETKVGFYDYLRQFNKDKPFFFYKTRLTTKQSEDGYYGFDYKCGTEQIDEATRETVIAHLKEIHAQCEAHDASVGRATPQPAQSATVPVAQETAALPSDPVYPTDEIDPDDIPF